MDAEVADSHKPEKQQAAKPVAARHFDRFAIVLPWVRAKSAETEFIAQLRRAASNLGKECVLIDRHGRDPQSWQPVPTAELDFAIATHFTTPKTLDCFSFTILNNPLQYFFEHGYQTWTERLLSHDDFLGVGVQSSDDQVKRSLHLDPLHLAPQLHLYTAVAEPAIEPKVKQRQLLYISTTWDRDRHRDLLLALDRGDLVSIYGAATPEPPDYRNYKGELPFDGRAVAEKIAEAGAVLALSSEAHVRAETVTSRLYEGTAAGAVVIADQNPFCRKHFGDSLLYVDTGREGAAEQIAAHLKWMDDNPEQAAEMAGAAQKIFRERFSADFCLRAIYDQLDERRKALQLGLDPADSTNPMVRVLYLLTDPSPQGQKRLHDFCQGQDYRRVQLQLLVEPGQKLDKGLAAAAKKRGIALKVQQVDNLAERSATRVGQVLAEGIREALKDGDFEYLCVLTSAERPFSNHLSSLVRLLRARPDCTVAATAEVFEKTGPAEELPFANLWMRSSVDFSEDLDAQPAGFARFLLRRDLLTDGENNPDAALLALLHHLNRKAMAALVVDRPLAQSNLATVLVDAGAPFFVQPTDAEHEDPLIRQLHPGFAVVSSAVRKELQQQDERLRQQDEQIAGQREQLEALAAAFAKAQKKRRRRTRRSAAAVLLAAVAAAIWWAVL